MALALVLAAHQQRGRAAGLEADLRVLHAGRAGALDGVGDAQAAELAALRRFFLARGVARVVAEKKCLVHPLFEFAAVVGEGECRLVGHGRGRQQVPAAQLDAVHAELRRRLVHDPLDHIDGLGPARAAVRPGRIGIGIRAAHAHMRGPEPVHPDQRADVGKRRRELPVGRNVGADVADGVHAQRKEPAAGVQRQLGLAHAVAAVLVGQQRFAAVAGPLDRAAELLRQPQHEPVLGVGPALAAERAAHVARHHADAVLGDAEDFPGQHLADAVGVLRVALQRVAVLARVVAAQRAARFHVLGVHPRDRVGAFHHMRGRGERRIGRGAVARFVHVAQVVCALVPHGGGAGAQRRGGIGHRGAIGVVDHDEVSRVPRLHQGFGHHRHHGIAYVAHAALGEAQVRLGEHRRAVRALALDRHDAGAKARCRKVGVGIGAGHAGRRKGGGHVDGADVGVRVRRAHVDEIGLARQVQVVDVAALAAKQPRVLISRYRLADAELSHASVPFRSGVREKESRAT